MTGPTGGRQRGVALLMALLVVALASAAAVALIDQGHLQLRRTTNLIFGDQADRLARGGVGWAQTVLQRDAKNTDYDASTEQWAIELPPTPVEGGEVWGHIEDRQGRFNLNNLVNADGQPNERAVQRFQRLLQAVEADPTLVQGVVDWIDPDIDPQLPNGAEDTYYLGLDEPYRCPNRRMIDASELRLVKGFDAALYKALKGAITALPEVTDINVNTAPPLVLRALVADVRETRIDDLVTQREEVPYESLEGFLAEPVISERPDFEAEGLGVVSHYFAIHVGARIDRAYSRLTTLVHRSAEGRVTPLYQSHSVQ